MLDENNGVLMTREAIRAGISKTYFMEYVKRMGLERVAMGIYLSEDAWADYFYLLQVRYPKVIFSHETTLYLLELGVTEAESPTGHSLRVYNIERTICDLLRSWRNIGIQDLQGALKGYVRSKEKISHNLCVMQKNFMLKRC